MDNQQQKEQEEQEINFLGEDNPDNTCDILIANQDGKYLRITNDNKLFFDNVMDLFDSNTDSYIVPLRISNFEIKCLKEKTNKEINSIDDIIKDLLFIGIERDLPIVDAEEAKKLIESQESILSIVGKYVKIDPSLGCGRTNLTFSFDLSAKLAVDKDEEDDEEENENENEEETAN